LGGEEICGVFGGLPEVGSKACEGGGYVRKHNPWADFADVPGRIIGR